MQNKPYDNIEQNTTEGKNIIIKMNEKLIILFNLASLIRIINIIQFVFYFIYSYYDVFYFISVIFNLCGYIGFKKYIKTIIYINFIYQIFLPISYTISYIYSLVVFPFNFNTFNLILYLITIFINFYIIYNIYIFIKIYRRLNIDELNLLNCKIYPAYMIYKV